MTIGKKISADLRVVSVQCDTAIDWSETSKLDYIETRDEELIKALPGEQLTWFTIRPLSPGVLAKIKALSDPEDRLLAFQFGVVDCSDLKLGLRWNRRGGGTPHIESRSLEGLPSKVWREIGGLVIQREDLTEGESPRFAL